MNRDNTGTLLLCLSVLLLSVSVLLGSIASAHESPDVTPESFAAFGRSLLAFAGSQWPVLLGLVGIPLALFGATAGARLIVLMLDRKEADR